MTDTSHAAEIEFHVIRSRNRAAQNIVAGFAAEMHTLDYFWRYIATALNDVPALLAELAEVRLSRANLIAAVRAAIAAQQESETDPLSYLCDELSAQDQRIINSNRWPR